MIRIIDSTPKPINPKTKPMYDMQPLEVCVIIGTTDYKDHIVMRTAAVKKFEVIDLTCPGANVCWTRNVPITVRELYPGETYTLELS